ncbi:hypothetical protein BKA60DRAFT_600596 [Fusarium oxysporum]|nr:hypothetical protein BKA60DRAFT_600596 [Fusarium oxysporum]
MRIIFVLVVLLKTSLVTASSTVPSPPRRFFTPEGFIKVDPGGLEDVEVTTDNLLSETLSTTTRPFLTGRGLDAGPLPIKLVNNFNKSSVKAYITGLDAGGKVFFALHNGKLIYPDARGSRLPVKVTNDVAISLPSKGESLSITLPSFIRSGRIYFSNGDLQFFVVDIGDCNSLVQPSVTNLRDPNANVSWGFVEFTYIRNLLYANISYVDFVGLVLGMMLVAKDGSTQTTAGLEADAVIKIYTAGKPIRVLSPGSQHDVDPEIFGSCWKTYVDRVWERYIARDLIIDTQSKADMVKCRIVDHKLKCDGHERGLPKPDDKDIWGCNSGPFAISENDSIIHTAIVPRLCAGLVRSILLLDGGFMQPSLGQTSYYTVNPTNHYSRIVHSYVVDGRGYAFSYDDVNPDNGEEASGVVSSDNVHLLTIHAGGPLSNYSSHQ